MADKEEVKGAAAGKADEKEEKEDESKHDDPLSRVAVAAVVDEIAAELQRTGPEAEGVRQALERHWVRTMADYSACLEGKTDLSDLPALVRVKLAERVEKLKNVHEDLGPTLEEVPEETQEDKEQKRVVAELARAFEAGEKNKVCVKVYVNKLENLSTADWTVGFDIGIQCWFIDEKHVGHAEGEVSWRRVVSGLLTGCSRTKACSSPTLSLSARQSWSPSFAQRAAAPFTFGTFIGDGAL